MALPFETGDRVVQAAPGIYAPTVPLDSVGVIESISTDDREPWPYNVRFPVEPRIHGKPEDDDRTWPVGADEIQHAAPLRRAAS